MVSMMIPSSKQRVSSLVKTIILRKQSNGPTKTIVSTKTPTDRQTTETATLIKARGVFGTLSTSGRRSLQVQLADKTIPDDPDDYDTVEFNIEPRKNAYYYKYEIPKYARQGATGLRKALELFQQMKSKDRLEPTSDNFSTLIYGCAKAGYTKRAFDLYEESLKYFKRPTNSVVTCLINSCAESPFPEYGLERLKWFLTHIKVAYNKQLNEVQYNSAIKAFGKLGQLVEASRLVQEMLDNNIMPSVDTFNMLLIGCASNRESGCAIALRVFKRLRMYDFKPTVVTYRLLLRCIRDCKMGSADLIDEIINELPAITAFDQRLKYKKTTQKNDLQRKFTSGFEWVPLISGLGRSIKTAIHGPKDNRDKVIQVVENDLKSSVTKMKARSDSPVPEILSVEDADPALVSCTDVNCQVLPNLLSDDHLDLVTRIKSIQFDKLEHSFDRLLLFGGIHGFLETMIRDNCKPDEKTFSLLMSCLRPTRENYLEYHKLAVNMNINRDLVYYDHLIGDICDGGLFPGRLELALHFVEQMHLDNLRPNISTFESLAGGCATWAKAKQLMDDVEKCGFVVSSQMIAKFFGKATRNMNYQYLNSLIDYCVKIQFKPSKHLVEDLENLRIRSNDLVLKHEKNGPNDLNESTIKSFDRFQSKLNSWLKSTELEQEEHPWKQFKVNTSSKRDGFREYKKHFKAMEELKEEAIKRGHSSMGNLAYEAQKLVRASA